MNDYYGAIADATRALENGGGNQNLSVIGKSQFYLKDFNSAIITFNNFINKSEDNNNYYYKEAFIFRGNSKLQNKDFYGAISDFTTCFNDPPDTENKYLSMYFRATAKGQLGDITGEYQDYTTYLKFVPNNANALFYRGNNRGRAKDMSRACSDWRKAARLGHRSASDNINSFCN